MSVADKMKAYRKRKRYSIKDMSILCGVSETLLKMVENGLVTHPKLAKQIGEAYKLDEAEIYQLMPENYRPGAKYDPDKYKPYMPEERSICIRKEKKKEQDYNAYVAANNRAIKEHGRRGVIK